MSKIPSAIWYDNTGKPMSFGADTLSDGTEIKAEDQKWFLVKNFKLHLHPDELRTRYNLEIVNGQEPVVKLNASDPLPPGVTKDQVYTDFLKYLFQHTEKFFKDIIVDGKVLWPRHRSNMEFVIAHPNAWSTREQAFLRKVATQAGLVNASNASTNVRFVTEAEASVLYCLYDSNLADRLKPGTNFVVCDVGGSTVDSTLYSVASTSPLFKLKEKRAPGCVQRHTAGVQAGAIYVDRAAQAYMETAYKRAELSDTQNSMYCKAGIRDFEAFAKRTFRNRADGYVNIGNMLYTAGSAGVRRGRMTISTTSMKSFFDVCIKQIFANMDELIRGINVSVDGMEPLLGSATRRRFRRKPVFTRRTQEEI
ncbi:hypothetical protein FRC11_007606 [Ceratobasidium sp. 423]|nr:hypothetical protein FRC11_007606 [Ceratobasidium sp. 423]